MTSVRTTAPPTDHLQHLARAQEIRLDRVRVKRSVAAGVMDVRTVLEAPPESCRRASVFKVLQWAPRIGPSKAREILKLTMPGGVVSETITVELLSPRTREALISHVSSYCITGGRT